MTGPGPTFGMKDVACCFETPISHCLNKNSFGSDGPSIWLTVQGTNMSNLPGFGSGKTMVSHGVISIFCQFPPIVRDRQHYDCR